MFKLESNAAFNNNMFNAWKIHLMHETTERLYQAAKILRKTEGQSAVARLLNISPQTVKNWEARGVSKQGMIEAQLYVGCRASWIATGEGEMADLSPSSDTNTSLAGAKYEPSNLEQASDLRGKVPLISFVQAGEFAEVIDNFHPGDGEDWIDVTCPVNRHTFALRIVGDSMEPDFPEGMIIVVEPEMQAEPGDYVVAKNGDDATFKQLIRDGADWYLRPINPRYPIKPLGSSRIIGVVREAVRRFR